MDHVDISIIIPYYKGQAFILRNLNSIFKSYEKVKDEINIEIIIIIDSPEEYDSIILLLNKEYESKNIKILKNDVNMGVAYSRNRGLNEAHGKFIVFLDQDDFLDINYFINVKDSIHTKIDLIIVNGFYYNQITHKKIPVFYVSPKFKLKRILKGNIIPTPGLILFKKEFLNVSNFFISENNSFKGNDDWAAYINMFLNNEQITIDYVNKKIVYYVLHNSNFSNDISEMNENSIKVVLYFNKKTNSAYENIFIRIMNGLRFEKMLLGKKNKIVTILFNYKYFSDYLFMKIDINRIFAVVHKKIIGFYK